MFRTLFLFYTGERDHFGSVCDESYLHDGNIRDISTRFLMVLIKTDFYMWLSANKIFEQTKSNWIGLETIRETTKNVSELIVELPPTICVLILRLFSAKIGLRG